MLDPAIGIMFALSTAGLFAAASVHKLRDFPGFAAALDAYELLPPAIGRVAARCIPIAELLIAVALIPARLRPAGAVAGCLLLLIYALAVSVNLLRGRRDIDCGCGGPGNRRHIAPWMVWRNVALAAAAAIAALPWRDRPLVAADLVTIGGAVATAAFLYLALDRLLGDVAPRAAALRGPNAEARR